MFLCLRFRAAQSAAVAAVAAQFAQFAQSAAELHAELHAGSSQKMVGACFQFQGTSKAQVPLVLSSITFLPSIGGFDT